MIDFRYLFFFAAFFEILPKFSDFVNSDDYIRKIICKYIKLQPASIKKKDSKVIKNLFFQEKK